MPTPGPSQNQSENASQLESRRKTTPLFTEVQRSKVVDISVNMLRSQGSFSTKEILVELSQNFDQLNASEEQIAQIIIEAEQKGIERFRHAADAYTAARASGEFTTAQRSAEASSARRSPRLEGQAPSQFTEDATRGQWSENTSSKPQSSHLESLAPPQSTTMGPLKKRERKSGKNFSEKFSNVQIRTMLKLRERLVGAPDAKKTFWPELVALWKEAYPDYPDKGESLQRALQYVYKNLNHGDRLSETFKSATDEGIPIPKRGATAGKEKYADSGRWVFREQYADFLKTGYQRLGVQELTDKFAVEFPEMQDVTPGVVQNWLSQYGLITGEGRGHYTYEQKAFLLRRFEASLFTNWSNEEKNKVVREFCERFKEPAFDRTKLARQHILLRGQDSENLKQKSHHKLVASTSRRAKARQILTVREQEGPVKKFWRRQCDIEILKAYNEKGSKDQLKDLAVRIRQTTAYRKNYEGRKEPSIEAFRGRKAELEREGWTFVKLEEEIARLGALLQTSEDESEDDEDDDDLVEESDGDNENEDSNSSNDNGKSNGDSDSVEYYWSEEDRQAFENWKMTFHAYRSCNDYVVD